MRVLITGFDKFGGESINPSSLCVNSLPNVIDNIEIKKLPCLQSSKTAHVF